jgi:hypothetical protein
MELVKYLASISDDLEENDIKILMRTPIWPKDNSHSVYNLYSSKIQRFIANELYVPSIVHREFRLPLIDWNKRWTYKSHEGNIYDLLYVQYINKFYLKYLKKKFYS